MHFIVEMVLFSICSTAGVKAAMVTDLQEGPTETAMTVMVSHRSQGDGGYVVMGLVGASFLILQW